MRKPKLLLPQGLSTCRVVRTAVEEVQGRVGRAWIKEEVIWHEPLDTDPINITYLLWVSEGFFPASSSRRSLLVEKNCGLRVPRGEWEGTE